MTPQFNPPTSPSFGSTIEAEEAYNPDLVPATNGPTLEGRSCSKAVTACLAEPYLAKTGVKVFLLIR